MTLLGSAAGQVTSEQVHEGVMVVAAVERRPTLPPQEEEGEIRSRIRLPATAQPILIQQEEDSKAVFRSCCRLPGSRGMSRLNTPSQSSRRTNRETS